MHTHSLLELEGWGVVVRQFQSDEACTGAQLGGLGDYLLQQKLGEAQRGCVDEIGVRPVRGEDISVPKSKQSCQLQQ